MALWIHPRARLRQALVDDELSCADRRRVLMHLRKCDRCSADVSERMAILNAVRGPEPDAATLGEVRARLFAAIANPVVIEEVRHLLGPMAAGGSSIDRQLTVFVGKRAAAHLKDCWVY